MMTGKTLQDGTLCGPPVVSGRVADGVAFRHACSFFPTGVAVVTRVLDPGGPHGLTVNSFTPVSLDPPLILVCFDRRSRFLSGLAEHTPFAVNILSAEQHDLSIHFANAVPDRCAEVPSTPGLAGVPLLAGAVVNFECEVTRQTGAGDHVIVLGAVLNVIANGGPSLAYYRRAYHSLDVSAGPRLAMPH